jgi:hypothetical protein
MSREETYSPQKHEWGTKASVRWAKKITPNEGKKVKRFREFREGQVDELSKNLLRRYKKKADAQTTAHSASIDRRDPKNPKNPTASSTANFNKRMKGSNMAHDKLGGKYAKVPATDANKGKRVP